jgi:hypothetical protein
VHKVYDVEKAARARRFLRRVLGEDFLSSKQEEEHKLQRKNIAPAFRFQNVKGLYPGFCAKSKESREAGREGCGGRSDGVLNICHHTTQVALDLIRLSGMGPDTGFW